MRVQALVACVATKSIRTVAWCAALASVGFTADVVLVGEVQAAAGVVVAVGVVLDGRAVARASSTSSNRSRVNMASYTTVSKYLLESAAMTGKRRRWTQSDLDGVESTGLPRDAAGSAGAIIAAMATARPGT